MRKICGYVLIILFSLFFYVENVSAESTMYLKCANSNTEDESMEEFYVTKVFIDGKIYLRAYFPELNEFLDLTEGDGSFFGTTFKSWNIEENTDNLFNVCPETCAKGGSLLSWLFVGDFGCTGTKLPIERKTINDNQYTFFRNKSGKLVSLSYTANGLFYEYVNGEYKNTNIAYLQHNIFKLHLNENFWDLGGTNTVYANYNLGADTYSIYEDVAKSIGADSDTRAIDVIFNSGTKKGVIQGYINEWLTANGIKSNSSTFSDFLSRNAALINSCKQINENSSNGTYKDIENVTGLINNLGIPVSQLETIIASNSSSNYDINSITTNSYIYALGKMEIKEDEIGEEVAKVVKRDITKYLNDDKKIYDVVADATEYADMLYDCANNVLSYSYKMELNTSQIESLNKIRDNYKKVLNNLGYSIVTNCEDLLSEGFLQKLNSYMGVIRIGVPILIIVLGMLDFSKAVLSSSEDDMKKAQSRFTKRLLIGVAIFFLPTLINLILDIANSVWSNVGTGTCGIK